MALSALDGGGAHADDHGHERGSALILALVVLTVVGVIAASSLSYLQTSLTSTNRVVKPDRDAMASADGAMQTAVAYVRLHPELGRGLGFACPTATLTFPATSGNATSGVCPRSGSNVRNGMPLATLLTLGTSASERGIDLRSNGSLVVYGDTFSNSTIRVANRGGLVVHEGRSWARRACSGTVTLDTGMLTGGCNLGAGPTPAIASDPGYAPATATPPPPGSGTCFGTTAQMNPGTYTLASWQAGVGACSTVWLVPGVFVLDFANNVWSAVARKIVAGVPTTPSPAAAPYPGGCDPTLAGVQIVFAGASRISLTQGSTLDVCGLDTAQAGSTVKIALFGLTSPLGAVPAQNGCVTRVSGCAVVQASGAGTGINIAGTAYLPHAYVSIQPNGGAYTITNALVVRALRSQTPNNRPAPVIGTVSAPRSDGDVVIDATIAGTAWATARLALANGGTSTPTVTRWVVQR
jgi:hypothetical protein